MVVRAVLRPLTFVNITRGFEAAKFLQARFPLCHPTNSVKALKANTQETTFNSFNIF